MQGSLNQFNWCPVVFLVRFGVLRVFLVIGSEWTFVVTVHEFQFQKWLVCQLWLKKKSKKKRQLCIPFARDKWFPRRPWSPLRKDDILLLCARSERVIFFKHSYLGCKICQFSCSKQEQVGYLFWVSMFLHMLEIPEKSWGNVTVFLNNLSRENNYQHIQYRNW